MCCCLLYDAGGISELGFWQPHRLSEACIIYDAGSQRKSPRERAWLLSEKLIFLLIELWVSGYCLLFIPHPSSFAEHCRENSHYCWKIEQKKFSSSCCALFVGIEKLFKPRWLFVEHFTTRLIARKSRYTIFSWMHHIRHCSRFSVLCAASSSSNLSFWISLLASLFLNYTIRLWMLLKTEWSI